jgi:hypothetical protein
MSETISALIGIFEFPRTPNRDNAHPVDNRRIPAQGDVTRASERDHQL